MLDGGTFREADRRSQMMTRCRNGSCRQNRVPTLIVSKTTAVPTSFRSIAIPKALDRSDLNEMPCSVCSPTSLMVTAL